MGDVIVRDSERNSLFDSGKSMSTFRVQDQDGLGSCYANAASAVLKSVLPGNPDVSYTQAALEASTSGANTNWARNNQRFNRADGKEVRDVTWGGFNCRTIDALKAAGGACPASQAILENRSLQNSNVQSKLMKSLGAYFDDMNAIQSNPEEARRYADHLALAVESLNTERARLIDECNAEKASPTPLSYALKKLIGTELLSLKNRSCDTHIRSAIQALLPQSTITSDRNNIVITDELKNKLQTEIDRNPAVKALLVKSVSGSLTPAESLRLMDGFGGIINNFLKTNVVSMELIACQGGPYAPSEAGSILGTTFAANMRSQRNMNCEQEVSNEKIFEAVKTAESNQCIPPARLEVILGAIAPLMEVGSAIDSNILGSLTNSISNYGNQLKQLIAPGCQDRRNRINMDNVSCSSYSTCKEGDNVGSTFTGAGKGCLTLPEVKNQFGRRIISGIREGRALGIDVCTAFMNDPNVVSGFCKNAPPGVPGHSFHAMALSGYRCVAGKMEYEVLNSWGRESCPVRTAPYKNSAIECVLDSNGRPTGKFWAKEDVLLDNTTRINDARNGAR